jgi:hypothetical protein
MSAFLYISSPHPPSLLRQNDCPLKNDAEFKAGTFDFLSYQYIIGLGVVTFLYSLFFAIFYLLPVDENSRKYIPGLRYLCQQFLSSADINAYHHMYCTSLSPPLSHTTVTVFRVSDTIKQSSKSIEPIVDGGLFFMILIAAIRGHPLPSLSLPSLFPILCAYLLPPLPISLLSLSCRSGGGSCGTLTPIFFHFHFIDLLSLSLLSLCSYFSSFVFPIGLRIRCCGLPLLLFSQHLYLYLRTFRKLFFPLPCPSHLPNPSALLSLQEPVCIVDGIVRLIRASTAMAFLTALCVGFSFQVSLRSFLKEQKQRDDAKATSGDFPLPSSPSVVMRSPVDQEDTVRL